MPETRRTRRPAIVVSLALTLLVALVVAPGAGAHPGEQHRTSEAAGIGVVLYPGTAAEQFLPGFQYAGTPPVDGTEAPLAYAGNGCSPLSYAGQDFTGKIALTDRGDTSTPCPRATFFQRVASAEQAGAIGLVVVAADGAEPTTNGTAVTGGIPAMEVFRTAEILAAKDAVVAGTAVPAALDDTRTSIPSSGPAECIDGVARSQDGLFDGEMVPGVAFPCDNIDLLSIVGKDVIDSAGISDIWGWTDPGDANGLGAGDEYVMMGKTNGTALFNITDPTAPLYLGEIPNRSPVQQVWHDIKVFNNHAFIVSESERHGMSVFDLTRLRGLGASDGTVQFEPDTVYELTNAAHNLEINTETGFAYIVGGNAGLVLPDQCLSGLHMVDINEPKNPTFAGCFLQEGGPGTAARSVGEPVVMENSPAAYVHDTSCVLYDGPDTRYTGREVCFNSAEDGIVIADVTNKLTPALLGSTDYEGIAYAHQGALTDDHRFLLVNDELDEQTFGGNTRTMVINVEDLENPTLQYVHTSTETAIDHNNYVHEGFVYQSNYAAGLRVLDVANVGQSLTEVAFFDTYPAHTDPTFDGTWSNYPFFESGTIAVSGRNEGLFLVKRSDLAQERAGVELACQNCPVEIRAGEAGAALLAVENTGTSEDTYGFTFAGVPDGWGVAAEPATVAAGQSSPADVGIEVPRQAKAGTYTFTVTAASTNDPTVSDTETITVEVRKGPPSGAGQPTTP
ncbi:MAG: choice-of-anchor B family protein [Actinobacteria bacterium]|nr:choice-of-anchor B family protein [Actinomycetota bacterium]